MPIVIAVNFDDVTQHGWREWPRLAMAVASGVSVILNGSIFTELNWRRALERKLAMIETPNPVNLRWVYFERTPEACLRNVLRDMVQKPDREFVGRLRSLYARKDGYVIPEGEVVVPVYDPAPYVQLPFGKIQAEFLP